MKKKPLNAQKRHQNRRSRKKPITPRSRIVSTLRRLWMYSRERAERLRLDDKQCQYCGSTEHLEVHHYEEIPWDVIIRFIYKYILVNPKDCVTLCRKCHKIETDRQRSMK
jgi:5-methylcytosine-specific restriction endonuclease McrA